MDERRGVQSEVVDVKLVAPICRNSDMHKSENILLEKGDLSKDCCSNQEEDKHDGDFQAEIGQNALDFDQQSDNSEENIGMLML